MGISVKTRKMLWGRAACRCNEPTCQVELVMDISETDDPTLVGEECHIVARKEDGPRGDSPLTTEQRDLYSNLMLMCGTHHKAIDDNVATYPVDRLKKMKSDHEAWVRETLNGYDPIRQRDDELYAGYIQEWEERLNLEGWDNWAGSLLSHGQPSISLDQLEAMEATRRWLFRRVWPKRYPNIETALENFRLVLGDLTNWMRKVCDKSQSGDSGTLWVEKVYQRLDRFDASEYDRLGDIFDFNVGVAQDLTLELTRAANLVCQTVRDELMPGYRLAEGLVVVTGGPFGDLTWKTYRPQYASGTGRVGAYPGLDKFLTDRERRDVSFGFGISAEDYGRRERQEPKVTHET